MITNPSYDQIGKQVTEGSDCKFEKGAVEIAGTVQSIDHLTENTARVTFTQKNGDTFKWEANAHYRGRVYS